MYDNAGISPIATSQPDESAAPLCVDLDGTLLQTDVLYESILVLVKRNPFYLLWLPLWLLRGKAYMKRQVGDRTTLRVDLLPFCQPFVDYLQEERSAGRRLILTTGADEHVATQIADLLNLFDGVVASDGKKNFTGKQKLAAIRGLVGGQKFFYAGNSRSDLDVWRESDGAVVVNAPPACAKRLRRQGVPVLAEFTRIKESWKDWLSALRLHQWSKNVLVFVPIFLSHRVFDSPMIVRSLIAFAAFSLCASALYIVNDLLDLDADRLHPRKRSRPFASGKLPLPAGIMASALLLGCAAALASRLPLGASLILCAYAILTVGYSLYFKRLLLADVILLAGFYTIRMLFGGAAIGTGISEWTAAFAMFLFLSLAFVKRLIELRLYGSGPEPDARGRAYLAVDLPQLGSLAAASTCAATFVLALYIHSPEVKALYSHANVLWAACPLIFYWLSRIAVLANRGLVHDDPVVFTFKDRASYIIGGLLLLTVLLAI
ncbi:MAG TPA: UbiA family prenyltransferase [Bryobacteraceae bacterium]|nr:UbiA family prenyltransferase [Bryobacteraceae bacterium]